MESFSSLLVKSQYGCSVVLWSMSWFFVKWTFYLSVLCTHLFCPLFTITDAITTLLIFKVHTDKNSFLFPSPPFCVFLMHFLSISHNTGLCCSCLCNIRGFCRVCVVACDGMAVAVSSVIFGCTIMSWLYSKCSTQSSISLFICFWPLCLLISKFLFAKNFQYFIYGIASLTEMVTHSPVCGPYIFQSLTNFNLGIRPHNHFGTA